MFCQQCGADAPNESKFCNHCGHKFGESRISNKALIAIGITALVSVGSATLSYWPGSSPTGPAATSTPTPVISASPSPTPTPQIVVVRVTPKPRPTEEPELEEELEPTPTPRPYRPRPESTPDYPYRHTPTLVAPANGAMFAYYPRRLELRWTRNAASEAVGYRVRLEYRLPFGIGWKYWERDVFNTWYVEEMFPSTSTGRWTVTPILPNGQLGIPTESRTFKFTR